MAFLANKKTTPQLQAELDSQRRKVDVEHFDLTVREIVSMAKSGELQRAPSYQRKFRWAALDESRLIESLFLGLPVPSLFVATNKDGTWELVDGLQRVSTLLHFMSVSEDEADETHLKSIGRPEPLTLDGLEKLPSFNELTYAALPQPLQLSFSKRGLRVTALSDKSDPIARFDLFERLNTGGVALTPQEVRDCIFRGPFTELLSELADSPEFKSLLKLQEKRQHDGTREEQVLKFFAYSNARKDFKGDVKFFLNDYMEAASSSLDVTKSKAHFLKTVKEFHRIQDGKPFLRTGVAITPLNQFEAVLVAIGELIQSKKKIHPKKKDWANDAELIEFSTGATNTAAMLRGRIERAKALLS